MRSRRPSVDTTESLRAVGGSERRWACSPPSQVMTDLLLRSGPCGGCGGVETQGRAANARMPDTKIKPPATMNIRLTELTVTPANEARKFRRMVLVSQPEATTESMDANWLTGLNTAITRPRYSRGAASRSSGATAVFSMAIGTA